MEEKRLARLSARSQEDTKRKTCMSTVACSLASAGYRLLVDLVDRRTHRAVRSKRMAVQCVRVVLDEVHCKRWKTGLGLVCST